MKKTGPKYVYLDKYIKVTGNIEARLNYLERWNKYLKIAIIAILCGQIMPALIDWFIL